MDEYLNTTEAKQILRVTPQTLRTWAQQNKIRSIRTPHKQRLYNKQDVYNIAGITITHEEKKKYIYCRVSSKKQMDDFERQKHFLQSQFPQYILVTDIGSGINWKRKGLKTLLEQSMRGNVTEIVVAHRDRLCRFAFELLEFIFKHNNTNIVVLDTEIHQSSEQELADDLLSIVHIYSCRNMGKRRYKNQENQNLSQSLTEETFQTVDGDNSFCV